MPASEDDDVIDWGYLECEPSSSTFCGRQCDPFEPGFCPQHAYSCYADRSVNGTAYGCDCSRYYGCNGANCDQTSPTTVPLFLTMAIICFSITIPTIVKAAVALYKVQKAGKLKWGASTICLLYTMISAFFGAAYISDEWVYKMNTCAQSENDGGTSRSLSYVLRAFTPLMAMFFVLSVVQILLMWIDVHVKSKTMQKMSSENSLVEVYKKALRGFAIFFAMVFFGLFIINASYAIYWTFLTCIALVVITPIGAMNLIQLLTGGENPGGCCTMFCRFLKAGIPNACCCKRSVDRQNMIHSADAGSASGKFLLSRLKMADMVEKTAVRIWIGFLTYLSAAVLYVMVQPKAAANEAGALSLFHVSTWGILPPIFCAQRQVLIYCRFTLRDVLDPQEGSKRISAGMSVNSSTVAVDGDDA